MRIVVAGGRGKADFLIESLLGKKHEVTVVDDEEIYRWYLSEEYNIPVAVENPCKRYVLEEAEIDHVGILIALRPGDPDNLTACQTAKEISHVKQAAATVSNPRDVSVFKKLGINTAVSATYTIVKIIEQTNTIESLVSSLSIEQENTVLSKPLLTGECAVVNKKLKESSLPKNVVIYCILRSVDMVVSDGETALQEHNKLLLFCPAALQERVLDMLIV